MFAYPQQPMHYQTRMAQPPPHAYYAYPNYPNATYASYSPNTHTRHASFEPIRVSTHYHDAYATPSKPHRNDFPSQKEAMRAKANKSSKKPSSSKKPHVSVHIERDEEVYYEYRSPKGTPPPAYEEPREYVYVSEKKSSGHKTRPRASSTPQKPISQPKYKSPLKPPAQKATLKQAAQAGIPRGYDLKNWDPEEEPILILGSVFDANSLGKWIYDWTVYHHGAGHPIAENAGELWLGLIGLASKMKRAEECLPRIRRSGKREIIRDFLYDGDKLFCRLDDILHSCEDDMWDAATRDNGGVKPKKLGASSGTAFVEGIFGRDRELENTERLMADVRYWTHRFTTLCEPILRRPRE